MAADAPPVDLLNIDELKAGDVLSRVSYMKVLEVFPFVVHVRNENGLEWTIAKAIVAGECKTPDHWNREEKTTRTAIAEKLCNAVRDQAFAVQFTKQATAKRASMLIETDDAGCPEDATPALKKKRRTALGKDVIHGEKRVLRGHLTDAEPFMGRTSAVDLDADTTKGAATRLIDHRSIDWLVFDGVKYVVK